MIRNSNSMASLVLFPRGMLACSLIRIESAYCLESYIDESVMQPYFKRKQGQATFLFCEPYEYTLEELVRYGKINTSNVDIVCKHLATAVRALCSINFSFFEIANIEKTIFYIHGKFKVLPIFMKRKVQSCSN